MSEDTVDLVKDFYEARNRRDLAAVMELLHPEVEWDTSDRLIEPDVYRGHEAVRRAMQSIWEAWKEIQWTPEEFIDIEDDVVLVVVRVSGRGRGSGAPVNTTIAYVICTRDGKLVRLRYHGSKAKALEAVGLSE